MAPKYTLFTDATVDLPADICQQLEIAVIPMQFSFSETEMYYQYPDYREYPIEKFYDRIRAGAMLTTTQISVGEYVQQFTPALEAGQDILYIAFSSALSGSYNSARLAAEQLQESYPKATIACFDSLSASLGEGLLVWQAAKNRLDGISLEENLRWLEQHRDKIAHWFTIDDLKHLQRGGRCSALDAFMGTLLNIKPVLHCNQEGKLEPVEKVRSQKKALERMVEIAQETGVDLPGQTVFVLHGDNIEGAERISRLLREKCGVSDIIVNYAGAQVGGHCGNGLVGVFYFATQR